MAPEEVEYVEAAAGLGALATGPCKTARQMRGHSFEGCGIISE
jgi:hypothetical protein